MFNESIQQFTTKTRNFADDFNGVHNKLLENTIDNRSRIATAEEKLSGIEEGANNYAHPSSHMASMIVQDPLRRFVTDTEKSTWGSKETTAGALEKANAALQTAKDYADEKVDDLREDVTAKTSEIDTAIEEKLKLNGISTNVNFIGDATGVKSVNGLDIVGNKTITVEKTTFIDTNILYKTNEFTMNSGTGGTWKLKEAFRTIDVSSGDVLYLQYSGSTGNTDTVAIGINAYTADNVAISGDSVASNRLSVAYTVPANTSYVSIQCFASRGTAIAQNIDAHFYDICLSKAKKEEELTLSESIKLKNIKKEYLETGIGDLYAESYSEVPLVFQSGFINYHNGTVSVSSEYCYMLIDVIEGEKFFIEGYSYLAIMPVVMLDKNNAVVSYLPSAETSARTAYSNYFTIPSGCVKIAINTVGSVSSYPVYLQKCTGYNTKQSSKVTKISVLGDSLSASEEAAKYRWHSLLNKIDGYEVDLVARSGSGYKRNEDDGIGYAFYQQSQRVASDSEIYVVFGSFNDMTLFASLGAYRDTTIDTIGGCINVTIDNIYAINPYAKILLVTPTPWQNYYNRISSNATKYVDLIIEIARDRNIPYLDLYRESNLRPWVEVVRTKYYFNKDGVHPNNRGHREYLYPVFKDKLNSMRK